MYSSLEQSVSDILGQEIHVGNFVIVSHRNLLYICKILKITKKMIRVCKIKSTGHGWLVYPNQTVKIANEDATTYILKNS